MVAGISPAVTTPSAVLAGLGGVVLAVLAPLLVMRTSASVSGTLASANAATRWLLVFCLDVVASALLFTAGRAFGIIPPIGTLEKIGLIGAIGLCLTALQGLVRRAVWKRA